MGIGKGAPEKDGHLDNDMDKHVIKMAALGRRFQLGDLYNYRTDRVLTSECRLWCESADFSDLPSSATQTETGFKLKLLLPDSDTSNRWEHMGLDEHLKASILAGLFDKLKGASHYVNHKPNPVQVTRTLICRARSKKEYLDLPTLFNHNVPTISADGKIPDATHVVVGIEYGAEAYCVLAQGVPEEDEDAREGIAEFLTKMSYKMENALEEKQGVTEFKEQFDKEEKKLVNQIKCHVYADFQTQPVREFALFDAYKHCLKLVDQVKTFSTGKDKAVPIVAVLYPLRILMNVTGKLEIFEYRDVDAELVDRCCHIWTELEQVISRSEALRLSFVKTNRPALRQFIEVVCKFQSLLRDSWKKGIVKAREKDGNDDEVEKAANIAETHPLFKISRLNRWLRFKQAELEIITKMGSVKGITFLSGQTQLEKELADSFDKKFALVLNVPPLDERTKEIFGAMKDYVDNYTRLVAGDDDDDDSDEDGDENGLPWHMIMRKRKQVMGKVREMAEHVEKNKHLEDHVQFFITPVGSYVGSKKFECLYSVYEADHLLTNNLSQLPTPPTGLQVELDLKRPKMSSIQLKWDYEYLDYPYTFLVEYRLIDDPEAPWKQLKTSEPCETHMVISLREDSVFEIRVAAETCIGRSEYSEVINTESITLDVSQSIEVKEKLKGDPMTEAGPILSIQSVSGSISSHKKIIVYQPPIILVFNVTETTAEVVWTPSTSCAASSVAFSYSIRYWRNGQRSSVHVNVDSCETRFLLEDLHPGTTYSINIVAKSEDGQESAPSDVIWFTTQLHEVSPPVGSAQRTDETIIDEVKVLIRESATSLTKEWTEMKSVLVALGSQLNEKVKENTERVRGNSFL